MMDQLFVYIGFPRVDIPRREGHHENSCADPDRAFEDSMMDLMTLDLEVHNEQFANNKWRRSPTGGRRAVHVALDLVARPSRPPHIAGAAPALRKI